MMFARWNGYTGFEGSGQGNGCKQAKKKHRREHESGGDSPAQPGAPADLRHRRAFKRTTLKCEGCQIL